MRMRPTCGILVLLAATGCSPSGGSEARAAEGAGDPSAAPVALGKARTGALTVEHPLLGQVRSVLHAELAAGEPGEVREVAVREGDRVKKGQLLVEIDPSLALAQLRAAGAQRRQVAEELEQADRDAKRLTQAGRQLVAEREIEEATSRRTQLAAREAELSAAAQEARAILSRLRVVAPFDGQVKARSVDPGDWVSPGNPVVELVAVDRVEVLTDAPASLVPHLEPGGRALLRQGERTVEAEIRGVVRALDQATRTARIRLAPEEPSDWLLAGGTVRVIFQVQHETEDGAVIVPRDALVLGAVGTRVVRSSKMKARPVPVEVIVTSESEALVRGDGLGAGDVVVTRGNERLQPDQPLEPIEGGAT
ncbi:MAG: efflux RND transporter periplasmic adaptor subunit [Myxococcota bacterium]